MNALFKRYAYEFEEPVPCRSNWTFCIKLAIPDEERVRLMAILIGNQEQARRLVERMPRPLVEYDSNMNISLYFKRDPYVVQWSYLNGNEDIVNLDYRISHEKWNSMHLFWEGAPYD